MDKRTLLWYIFVGISLVFFLFYANINFYHAQEYQPYLKGLTALQHFVLHYSVGIFFGFIIWHSARIFFYQTWPLPLVLVACIVWSHFPDLLFGFGHIAHQPWMAVFFGHTIVDNSFNTLWPFVIFDLLFIMSFYNNSKKLSIAASSPSE